MSNPLNVLILEDSPADAELMVEVLRKAGFDPEWRRVEKECDFAAALDVDFDVILADHTLPQYDSVRALMKLQELNRDVPFVVVSGTINEELAVSLMKRGAADYVLKDRMARLGEAVAGALEERTLRRDKRRLEQSLVLFRSLLDRSNDVIEILDPETGQFLDVNEAACATYGYTREEFLDLSMADVEEPVGVAASAEAAIERRRTGFTRMESIHLRKDGTDFPVEVDSNFVRIGRDYTVMVVRDITERKQAEARGLRASRACSPLSSIGREETPNHARSYGDSTPLEILIIEDNPGAADSIASALRNTPIANLIRVARGGDKAFEFLNEKADVLPGLVLLDLEVPAGAGIEVLRRIRSDAHSSMIPVAAVVSSRDNADLLEARRLGIDAEVVKPAAFGEIAAIIATLGYSWLAVRTEKDVSRGPNKPR